MDLVCLFLGTTSQSSIQVMIRFLKDQKKAGLTDKVCNLTELIVAVMAPDRGSCWLSTRDQHKIVSKLILGLSAVVAHFSQNGLQCSRVQSNQGLA